MKMASEKLGKNFRCPPLLHTCILTYGNDTRDARKKSRTSPLFEIACARAFRTRRPRHRRRGSGHHVSDYNVLRSRWRCWSRSARHTTADRMAAHWRLDRRPVIDQEIGA